MLRAGLASVRAFIIGCLLIGMFATWAVGTARYGGPDEPAHILRAAAVGDGDLLGRRAIGLPPGYRSVRVPAQLTTGDPSCYRHDDDIPAVCGVEDPGATGFATAASSAGTYPPLYYALVGVPVRLLGQASDVLSYRLISAAWCAAVLAVAVVRLRRSASVGIICLTPAAWFLCGVVNPNSLEVALAVLAWVGVAGVRRSSAALALADVCWISVPLAVAILIRPVAVVAGVAVIGAAVISISSRREAVPGRVWLALFGPTVGSVVASFGWAVWAGVVVSDSRTADPAPLSEAVRRTLDDTTETWRELAGSLGWLEFSAPWFSHVIWWSIVGVAGWLALRRHSALRWSWLWVAGVMVVGPIAFEVIFASKVGFIWQGRYSIPTAIGLVVLGAPEHSTRMSHRASSLMLGAAMAAQVATLWVVLRRYTGGAHGSWWFIGAAWNPPVPPLLVVLVNVVLATMLTLAIVRATSARPENTCRTAP